MTCFSWNSTLGRFVISSFSLICGMPLQWQFISWWWWTTGLSPLFWDKPIVNGNMCLHFLPAPFFAEQLQRTFLQDPVLIPKNKNKIDIRAVLHIPCSVARSFCLLVFVQSVAGLVISTVCMVTWMTWMTWTMDWLWRPGGWLWMTTTTMTMMMMRMRMMMMMMMWKYISWHWWHDDNYVQSPPFDY